MGQLAPDWWRHGVRRSEWGHAPLREPSGNASKGGGAANGAERRAEPRVAKGGAPLYKRADSTRVWLVGGSLVGWSWVVQSHRQVEFGRRWWWVVKVTKKNLSLSPSLGPALVARRAACRRRRGREAQQSRLWGASLRVHVESAGNPVRSPQPLCRLCGASLRVRAGNAGESSLTTPGARGQARLR